MTARDSINNRLQKLKTLLRVVSPVGIGLVILPALVNSPDATSTISLILILTVAALSLAYGRLAPRCPFCGSRLPHFNSRSDYFRLSEDCRRCPTCRADFDAPIHAERTQ